MRHQNDNNVLTPWCRFVSIAKKRTLNGVRFIWECICALIVRERTGSTGWFTRSWNRPILISGTISSCYSCKRDPMPGPCNISGNAGWSQTAIAISTTSPPSSRNTGLSWHRKWKLSWTVANPWPRKHSKSQSRSRLCCFHNKTITFLTNKLWRNRFHRRRWSRLSLNKIREERRRRGRKKWATRLTLRTLRVCVLTMGYPSNKSRRLSRRTKHHQASRANLLTILYPPKLTHTPKS